MNSKTAPTQAGPLDLIVRRDTLTHKNAVKRMVLWLRNSRGCAVVMAERSSTYVIEKPDVIGWKSNSASILIECKVSRSDFLADKLKVSGAWKKWVLATFGISPRRRAC